MPRKAYGLALAGSNPVGATIASLGRGASMKSSVIVVDYDEAWPARFETLRARIWPALSDVALRVEHVGSTSVPGLAAKPIIDMTVVVAQRSDVPAVIERMATLGYRHQGTLGVEDREAFEHGPDLPRHNLYVCPECTIGLVNQVTSATTCAPSPRPPAATTP